MWPKSVDYYSSIGRFRMRLNLTSRTITQNATVRKAMEQLREIGYLGYTELRWGNTVYFHIHFRRPKLCRDALRIERHSE